MADPARAIPGPNRIVLAGALLAALAIAGCLSGSLATSTGDRAGGEWSIARQQSVHLGETVQFSFVLKKPLRSERIDALGLADYCVFDLDGERFDVDADEFGRFAMSHTFTDLAVGDRLTIRATAYRQVGRRDQMRIAGTWVTNQSETNSPDEKVAAASLHLLAYQCHVRMHLPAAADPYDFSTARLLLRRADGRQCAVFENRPPRHGFELVPRRAGEGWWVDYAPTGDQVNPYGETEIEFSIYDLVGNRHAWKDAVRTP